MLLEFFALLLCLYTAYKVFRRKICQPSFHNQTVWITGASSGIGEFLAYEFSKCGAYLIISARNLQELERVRSNCACPDKVQAVSLDMSKLEDVERVSGQVIEDLEKAGRKLDVVVENAGVSMRCKFMDYHFDNHKQIFDVNIHGPLRHIQCILPHMIRNQSGHIVGISSVAGKLASTYRSSYAASKHAFIGFLDSLRAEVRDSKIHVTNIMPGYISTNLSKNAFTKGSGEKLGYTDKNIANGISPDSFARTSLQAIFRKENELQISSGLAIPLGLFLRNVCPDLLFFMLWKNGKEQAAALEKGA